MRNFWIWRIQIVDLVPLRQSHLEPEVFYESPSTMLFSRTDNKKTSLYKQSLLNRLKPKLSRNEKDNEFKPELQSITPKEMQQRQRPRSLPYEAEILFQLCVGPVDNSLIQMAEIAQQKRRPHSVCSEWSSPQLNPEWSSFDEFQSRLESSFNSSNSSASSGKIYNTGQAETYIDENGIYTTVLCFTEI